MGIFQMVLCFKQMLLCGLCHRFLGVSGWGRWLAAGLCCISLCGCDRSYFGDRHAEEQGGREKIVCYTPFPDVTAQELARAFEAESGIKVEQILEGTTKIFARLRVEKRAPRCDVWYGGGGVIPFITASREGLLEAYTPPVYKDLPLQKGNLVLHEPSWLWSPIAVVSLGYCYNPQVTPPDSIPRTWEELADPRWRGGVEMWDPAESGTSMLFLDSAILRYRGADGGEGAGWRYLSSLFGNLKRYTREGKPAFSVARGETRIGLHFENQYLEFLDQMAGDTQLADVKRNIRWYLPQNSPVIAEGIALIKNGPNPEGGKRFIDFCLSTRGQKIVNRYYFAMDPTLPPPARLEGVNLDDLLARAQKVDLPWMAENYDRIRKKWQNDVESAAE